MVNLKEENERLRVENDRLRKQIRVYEKWSSAEKGVQAEIYICELVNGKPMEQGAPYDVTSFSGDRIEVKFASVGKSKGRWWWTKILGNSGGKQYDRLILVGDPNEKYRKDYLDSTAEFVLFDVPFDELDNVMTWNPGEPTSYIQLNTNPNGVKKKQSKDLYNLYQISSNVLKKKYGV